MKTFEEDRDEIYTVKNPASIPTGTKQIRNLTQDAQPVDDIMGLQEKCKNERIRLSVSQIHQRNPRSPIALHLLRNKETAR
ncbi:hypothetical protein RvY_02129 [Ramazzottius varieornatus]|uniref:Uncharacterized protein n=1 Tax=Ramazzottius varieornatus TaxID=947166 RepID=A0A1D1UMF4_RAMVA|nr:hypothetical protein RvY_02129 [Ramazzottius varieornatus]